MDRSKIIAISTGVLSVLLAYLATKYTSTQSKDTPQIYRKAGSMKGTFSMAEDFDEPLDDLKAYMES